MPHCPPRSPRATSCRAFWCWSARPSTCAAAIRGTRAMSAARTPPETNFSPLPTPKKRCFEDLISVTGGPANIDLAKFAIRQSSMLPKWMSEHGANWQQPLAGTLSLGRTNRFFLGGGKALLNAYYRTAHSMGITVRYDAFVEDLIIENDRFEAVALKTPAGTNGRREIIRGRAVVVATGGYEANLEWLKRHWGAAADNFIVRGTPYNDGAMLANLLSKDAKPMGDPKGFHAVAVDARSPKFDGGIVTRLDAIPFGVVVNKFGCRFYDEGEAIWPKRYAIWGGLIARQPDQIAYVIVDAKTIGRFLPPMFKPYQADSLEALARALNLDPVAFCAHSERIQSRHLRPNRAAPGNSRWKWNARNLAAQKQLGDSHRHAALLRTSPPSRHHVHLHGRGRRRYMPRADRNRQPLSERLRGGRNHVRQYSYEGLSRGLRHDDRRRVRRTRGKDGGHECPSLICSRKPTASWSSATPAATARDCARYSAPSRRAAISARPTFSISPTSATTAASATTPACSRPRTNSPSIFRRFCRKRASKVIKQWSWPGFLGRAFKQSGITLALAGIVSVLVVLLGLALVGPPRLFTPHTGPGAFYAIVPYLAMVIPAVALFFYGIAVWFRGTVRAWSETNGRPGQVSRRQSVA